MRSRLTWALSVAALCMSIPSASAATGDLPVKAAQFGSTEDDFIDGLAVMPDGGFVVVGFSFGALPGSTTSVDSEAYVRLYDPAGCERWTSLFGTDIANAEDVAIAPSGNIVVSGSVLGDLPGEMGAGEYDAFVRAYDPSGTELWTDQFGTTEYDAGSGVAVDGAGNVYVTGQTQGSFPSESLSGINDAYVRKYGPAGNHLWTDQYGTTDGDFPDDVAVSSLGVFVGGMTRGEFPGESSAGDEDAFLTRFTPAGSNVGSVQFGTGGDDAATSLAVNDANVVAAGEVGGALPGQSPSGGQDAFVRAFNGELAELWTRQIGTPEFDSLRSVHLDPAGNVAVAGGTEGAFPGQTNDGDGDALVGRFGPDGALMHVQQFGTSLSDFLFAVSWDGGSLRVGGKDRRVVARPHGPGWGGRVRGHPRRQRLP